MGGIEIGFLDDGEKSDVLQVAALLRSGLEDCGAAPVAVQKSDRVEQLEKRLELRPATSHLLLYDPAEAAVARGVARGERPSECLARWKSRAERLKDLCRQHRRRLALAATSDAARAPAACIAALNRHAGLFDPDRKPGNSVQPVTAQPWTAWQGVLARQAVSLDREARRLDGELEAAALPLARPVADPDQAFDDLKAETEENGSEALWQAERVLLVDQLAQVQAELKERYISASEHGEEVEQVRRVLAGVEAQLAQERAARAETADELEATRTQLRHSEDHVRALRGSTSWKVTRPLRGTMRILTGRSWRDE